MKSPVLARVLSDETLYRYSETSPTSTIMSQLLRTAPTFTIGNCARADAVSRDYSVGGAPKLTVELFYGVLFRSCFNALVCTLGCDVLE